MEYLFIKVSKPSTFMDHPKMETLVEIFELLLAALKVKEMPRALVTGLQDFVCYGEFISETVKYLAFPVWFR